MLFQCQNCHRQIVPGNIIAPYLLEIGMYHKASINFRKKFSTMQAGDFDDVQEAGTVFGVLKILGSRMQLMQQVLKHHWLCGQH